MELFKVGGDCPETNYLFLGEETPERLYNRLLPNVIVKGGDYNPEDVVGGSAVIANGGEVKILSFVEGQSTSNMIARAKLG